jgi:hypothetical protein
MAEPLGTFFDYQNFVAGRKYIRDTGRRSPQNERRLARETSRRHERMTLPSA